MRLANPSQLLPIMLAASAAGQIHEQPGAATGTGGDNDAAATSVSSSNQSDLRNAGRGNFSRMVGMSMPNMSMPGMAAMNPLGELDFSGSQQAAGPTNTQPAGVAAQIFQEKYQAQVLQAPGSVEVTPADLGFKPHQLVMIDVGGEGQKTEGTLKSGSAHAININAQATISSTPIELALEPGQKSSQVQRGALIPNLIQPAAAWPAPDHKGKLLPLAQGFAGLTTIEGAPLFDYHVAELGRVTDKQHGWMALSVDESFDKQVAKLAANHGGAIWKMDNPAGAYPLQILPPQALANRDDLKARFTGASSHDLFDIVQDIRAR